ncbi:MAG: putative zinc-binding metallopeptidase [Dysgonamonadaceae bacterium]|jgi:substrate import-associated zinc metallohydrolase lipoprotein|nr:putative zinc-binding metallopeptidase [Dysgonamonadaceae bacterium]
MRLFVLSCLFLLAVSCREDAITNSGVETPAAPETELDRWIDTTFRIPYNIRVEYRWNSDAMDPGHTTVPPREELVQPFLQAVLNVWLNPYIQVAETGADFMKDYTCRQLNLVGSGSYNQGSVTLGLAKNGYTITLYTVNWFDLAANTVKKETLREYFRTMHHEFGHILNQRKPYDPNFQRITGNYSADWTALNDKQARELGFISAYARSADVEDFVEILSYYITYSDEEWQQLIGSIQSVRGQEYIRLKTQSVVSYMKNTYGVDLLRLRGEITTAIEIMVNDK